jgi:hypothetical protein
MADRFILNPILYYFIIRRLGNIEVVVSLSFIICHETGGLISFGAVLAVLSTTVFNDGLCRSV